MPTYIDTIVCEDIRPEIGNKLTLAGVFGEEIRLPQVPIIIGSLAIMQRWRATNEEIDRGLGNFDFEMEWPDGFRTRFPNQALAPVEKGINVTTVSFIFKFVGFPARLAGEYRFRTYLDNREANVYKFYVVLPTDLPTPQVKPVIGFQGVRRQ